MASPTTPLPLRSQSSLSDLDVSTIRGNISDDEKRFGINTFAYFVSTREKSYGAEIGQCLRMVEMNVWGRDGPAAWGETTFEITVSKDMCNIFGTLHGACAAYIVDPCSVSSLVTLGRAIGVDGTGVSQSMNLIWHQPAHLGTKLKVVATSIFIHGRVRSARCELWDGDKLCVSAIHSTINPWDPKLVAKGKL